MSRPGTTWQAGNAQPTTPHPGGSVGRRAGQDSLGRDRPLPSLPPLPLSLPSSYEIPSLRRRGVPDSNNVSSPEQHNRSASHPFPGIFGGKKNKGTVYAPDDDLDSSDSGQRGKTALPNARSGRIVSSKTEQVGHDPVTGKCMTCASTVRWPHGLKVFRCTTCSTVNDLEPYEAHEGQGESLEGAKKPTTASLERTKKMINQCIDTYLQNQLRASPEGLTTASSSSRVPEVASWSAHGSGRTELNTGGISGANYELNRARSYSPGRKFSQQQTQHRIYHPSDTASSTPSGEQDHALSSSTGANNDPKLEHGARGHQAEPNHSIFRPVEADILACFTGCAVLNASFFVTQSNSERQTHSDRKQQPTQKPASAVNTPQFEPDAFLSELDAKTLLLGDVAENGSWWTGRPSPTVSRGDGVRKRSPERWQGTVSVKSPRINWPELLEWYSTLIHAAQAWQQKWQMLRPPETDPALLRWTSTSIDRLQHDFLKSQFHLQRVLLKATENLLKRPRRQLRSPEDCRFLLMLLANPLLYSSYARSLTPANVSVVGTIKTEGLNPEAIHRSVSARIGAAAQRAGGLGQHNGIVKRILGLVSNLSNEIHQYLVSWLSRFSDGHFQKLVDLVSSFVTYRLSRQQDRTPQETINPTAGLVPSFSDSGVRHASELHAALELRPSTSTKKKPDNKPKLGVYSEDWQVRSAARVMALLFQANNGHNLRKRDNPISPSQRMNSTGLNAKHHAYSHGQILPISSFYNSMLDHADIVGDFEAWETTRIRFTFCQYPFFLSIWAKIRILEHDARRQMDVMAREAFFDSIFSRKAVSQFLLLRVRRDCLVDDSLRGVSEVVGSGSSDIKKALRIDFVNEEGVDAGGLRKEWFLLLVREIFDPQHGLFVYDEDSRFCYFNPFCFESSEQFFLVGVLLGLAIYNSTILDVAFPPFVFKKMLALAPSVGDLLTSTPKVSYSYTLEDLAEYRPALAKGLRQLLEFDGDVQEVFCRDFVVDMDRYGELVQVPLCPGGPKRPVTNSNRREFVHLYVRYLLDTAVVRQFEPFKRGFFSVCGGNALSLFQPEEIELLVRGSDEPLDVRSLRAVATYDNWPQKAGPPEQQDQVVWFWETFEQAEPSDQRKLLSFITGSDRIPAMGATNLSIQLQYIRDKEVEDSGMEIERFPIARTCFNTINLHRYLRRETLEAKLWMAVKESGGFGLK